MKKTLILFVSLLALSACGKNEADEKVKISDITLAPPPQNEVMADAAVGNASVDQMKFPPPVAKPDQQVTKKVIKEGNMSFETADVKATKKAINDQLKALGGYTGRESESYNYEDNRKEYTINARIPADQFDRFLSTVSDNAVKIDDKNISIRDVTTQFIDITTRLANKKKLEERYLELLKKGSKIADLLEIENKLNEVRTEIESNQGQLNYLNQQINYSTLDITFYTKSAVKEAGQTFGYKFRQSAGEGWDILVSLFFTVIRLWPVWLIAAGGIVLFRRWRRNVRKRKSAQ